MNADAPLVIDANVAVKWFVQEELSAEALAIAMSKRNFLAADIFPAEVANVLLTKVRAGDVTAGFASQAVQRAVGVVHLYSSPPLLPAAWEIAVRHHRTAYDALYVALALLHGCQLVTADRRLFNSLQTHYPDNLLWLGDVSPLV